VRARIARRCYLAAGAAATVAATAGCGAILDAAAPSRAAPAPVTLTAPAAPSMLVVVTGPGGISTLVRNVITETARPGEDLNVVSAGKRARALIASASPSPATVRVRGRPTAPGAGASSYQQGQYRNAMKHWRGEVTEARYLVAVRTKAAVGRWVRSLRLPDRPAALPLATPAASLTRECQAATSAVSGLINQAGSHAGARRVVLLDLTSLTGMPPAGELDGDDVVAVTSYLPSAAAASAAQVNLLAAGASRVAVLGPEATPGQVEELVSVGLTEHTITQALSGRALFGNDSARLLPGAASVLAPLIGTLRRPGTNAVINGYASATGSSQHNQALSSRRAAAVAAFYEARGVSQSSLLVVGHGATNFIGPGSSGDNRRVVVVIEEPTAGAG
jgi:outer membrane protein OmpA-like peptidoglycan-associated protein